MKKRKQHMTHQNKKIRLKHRLLSSPRVRNHKEDWLLIAENRMKSKSRDVYLENEEIPRVKVRLC